MCTLYCGHKHFVLGKRTLLMGIVNVTPDSFSDGGIYQREEEAFAHAMKLVEAGADILDVGAESTRPLAKEVSPAEELKRVLPFVKRLVRSGVRSISIDTRNASTAHACLQEGASWINDVSALSHDKEMVEVAQKADGLVLMHMRGTPETMQSQTTYGDVVGEVASYLRERVDFAVQAGVARDKIVVDPGIGFAKLPAHDLALIKQMSHFSGIGVGVLAGMSRKKFLGSLTGIKDPAHRDAATMSAMSASVLLGADIVRVHNVALAKEALQIIDAIKYGGVS